MWLNLLVDDPKCGNITKLEKKQRKEKKLTNYCRKGTIQGYVFKFIK
jgi:hypothetical protein